jgi:hypothetical protein
LLETTKAVWGEENLAVNRNKQSTPSH